MSRLRAFVGAHPLITGGMAVAAAAIVVALYWFEPQALILDEHVEEALPAARTQEDGDERPEVGSKGAQTDIATLSRGRFRELAHSARGTARLLRTGDGSLFVRFEDFEVENGPDLRVYLSAAPPISDSRFDVDFVDLGDLKGNVGSQNYRIPADADVDRFKSVVVWCRRFSVGFAVAPISAT
ncbi:MAG: DM13 domain-containing protein [Actinomycetota bacterium]